MLAPTSETRAPVPATPSHQETPSSRDHLSPNAWFPGKGSGKCQAAEGERMSSREPSGARSPRLHTLPQEPRKRAEGEISVS